MQTPKPKGMTLPKTHHVYLHKNGEICNRLKMGTRVTPVKREGDWLKITWRNGRKKGWIFYPEKE